MTWKSYTAVSGATVLAGWLASSPPSNAPGTTAGSPAQAQRRPPAAATDIEQQAERLQSRMRTVREYAEPQRDPFRFAERAQRAVRNEPAFEPAAPIEPVELEPAGPRITVSGIAEEQMDGQVRRTAVLSSPMGVLLVREGEDVLGYYRVSRIEAEAVEFVTIGDGSAVRMSLGTTP